ncbi:MAG: hypothetical protein CMJ84_15035 [Planctomycetes bacterium]|jgi:thiamine biosynthesis lipoprotein|nr:hypothetical protein [Planctomycetota bacterium]MDP6410212.1 FAD:protein FMN transferase [Planctomycetota bacterium]
MELLSKNAVSGIAWAALALAGCAGAPSAAPPTTLQELAGVLTDLDGATHDVDAALRDGRRVALVFWQTWCESCLREGPALARAAKRLEGEIDFLGVIPGPDEQVDEAEVRRVAASLGLSYPQVRDRDLAWTHALAVEGTPTIVVLGPGREVLYHGHRPPSDWSALSRAATQLLQRELAVMGTQLQLEVLGEDADQLERAMDAAVAELLRVEDLMTDWRPSELMRLNEAAGTGPVEVPAELTEMIARALEIASLTGGAFDPTYAGAGALWDYRSTPPRVPSPTAIEAALEVVGHERVRVDLGASTVALPAGARLGLGGIAKGYGVDRAMAILMEHGVEHALVNAGGDLKALGTKHGELWQIAIRHPRDRERALAVIPISNACVVTSGDYERFFEHEGRRYHHVIDPRTGYPSEGCMSATVVAPDAAYADALATALCVLAPPEGLALVATLARVEALLVDMEGRLHASEALKGALAAGSGG